MEDSKACGRCKSILPISQFHLHKKSKDGLQSNCIDCKRELNRFYMDAWRKANPEEHRKRNKKSRDSNPARTADLKQKSYQANRQKRLASMRKYYEKNPEPARLSASIRKRRLQSGGEFQILKKEIRKLYNSTCLICNEKTGIEADHVIPVAKGGRHSIGNLIPLCKSCNRTKSDRFLIEFKIIYRRRNAIVAA